MAAGYFSADSPNPELHLSRSPCGKDIEELVALALRDENQPVAEDVRAFQSIVSALLYAATNTRPDVSYAVGDALSCYESPYSCAHGCCPTCPRGDIDRTKDVGLRYEVSDVELY